MSNPEKGETTLTIAGVVYRLAINTNALIEVEALFSTPAAPVTFQDVLKRVQAKNLAATRGFLWALLRKYHGDLTLEDVGDLIDALSGERFVATLADLAGSVKPDQRDLDELGIAPARPRRAQTTGGRGGIGIGSTATRAKSA